MQKTKNPYDTVYARTDDKDVPYFPFRYWLKGYMSVADSDNGLLHAAPAIGDPRRKYWDEGVAAAKKDRDAEFVEYMDKNPEAPPVLEKLTDEEAAAYIQEVARDAPVVEVADPNAGTYADHTADALRYATAAPKGIGDVNSNARGSGARFNAGKVKVQYIPAEALKSLVLSETPVTSRSHQQFADAMGVLAVIENRTLAETGSQFLGKNLRYLWLVGAAHIDMLASTCEVFEFGAKKYAAWNWAKGMPWSVPVACIKRHLMRIAAGEDTDQESGLPHWGHIGCNIVMLLHFNHYYMDGDDRPSF